MMKVTKTFRVVPAVIVAAGMLALVAVTVPQDARAGTLTVSAPKEAGSIRLGVKDPPASAKLEGWYCTKLDGVQQDVNALTNQLLNIHNTYGYRGGTKIAQAASRWYAANIDKGWPLKNVYGMQKSPAETGLDAPPGGTRVYEFKYCYTADELQTVHDKTKQWLKAVMRDGKIHMKQLPPTIRESSIGPISEPEM